MLRATSTTTMCSHTRISRISWPQKFRLKSGLLVYATSVSCSGITDYPPAVSSECKLSDDDRGDIPLVTDPQGKLILDVSDCRKWGPNVVHRGKQSKGKGKEKARMQTRESQHAEEALEPEKSNPRKCKGQDSDLARDSRDPPN